MSWIKDEYIDGFICPHCGNMVRDNGYGGCDYKFCPHCSEAVEPVHSFPPRPFMTDNGPTLDEVIEAFLGIKPFLETTQGGDTEHE